MTGRGLLISMLEKRNSFRLTGQITSGAIHVKMNGSALEEIHLFKVLGLTKVDWGT